MYNIHLHMRHLVKNLLAVAVLIFFYTNCSSQNEQGDSLAVVDTSVTTEADEAGPEDKEEYEFDSLSAYDIPSYQPHDISDSVLVNLKKDEAFWYANQTPTRQKPVEIDRNKKERESFYLQDWFRTLTWIVIIGAFVAVLIWFLIASDVRLFRKKPKVFESDTDVAISEDIFAVNYEQELAKAIANENYRLGVRLMYLHVLRLFAESNIIEYKIERTNSEYLFHLYNSSYYKDFFRLTRNFEYVWYGKFDISAPAFEIIRQNYTNLKIQL